MKRIWGYIHSFIDEDYAPDYYISVALFLAILLFFGFYFDLENKYLRPLFGSSKHFLFTFLSLGTAYFGTLFIQKLFGRTKNIGDYHYWIAIFFCLLVQSYDLSFSWHGKIANLLPGELRVLSLRVVKNFAGLFTVLLPMYFFHRYTHSDTAYYGLTRRNFQYKPYIILAAVALLGIAISTKNGEINAYYPTYKTSMGNYFQENEWIGILLYEASYAFDFVSIELIYRGFLVIGLAKWLGKDAIIPMVTTYCLLHFGKPLPEAISSIFGGYLLGIIAYKSKNILGGVVIHISIALGM